MKILALSDLHIGKKLNDLNLLEDQEFVLKQAVELVEGENISAVLICGDIFDKPIPTIEAINLFSNFLEQLNKLDIKIYIISGNHDNIDRLSYLSPFLEKSNIYFSRNYNGKLQKYSLNNEIDIYLMPYLYPGVVRKFYPQIELNSYQDAIRKVIEQTKINEDKFNILLAHQFVLGNNDNIVLSDSEQKSVGTIDSISYQLFDKFDYIALGHLHCPQRVGNDKTRYCGSILKYSLSEINQNKVFTILEINNKEFNVELRKIEFLRDIKRYKGKFKTFLDKDFYSTIETSNYIHFILEDEEVIDAKKELSRIYPNIILLEFDNSYTRSCSAPVFNEFRKNKTIEQYFIEFFELQTGTIMNEKDKRLIKEISIDTTGGCS